MAKVYLLLSLLLALWARANSARPQPTLSEGVERVLKIIEKPSKISTIFCGNVADEFELIHHLSTSYPGSPSSIPLTSRFATTSEYFQHLFILDISHCRVQDLLPIFSAHPRSFIYSQWLIVSSLNPFGATHPQQIQEIFREVNISQLSEIFFLTLDKDQLQLMMTYKMQLVAGNELIFEEMGHFTNFSSSGRFLDIRPHNVTSMRRRDMKGSAFPIASVLTNPDSINHYFDFVNIEVDAVGKSGHRLGVAVLQFMHATPNIIPTNSWGSFNSSSGLWTGMMGDLISGKAEFGGTPSFIVAERTEIIEYLSVSLESWTRIVFRAPKLSYTTNVYLLPFERGVWIAAMVLFAAMTLLLLAAAIGEWKFTKGVEQEDARPRFSDMVFVIFSAICNQGSSFGLHSVAGRIVFLSCLVMVVCLFVSYCAFIVVLLQSPATNIKTAQDLLHSRMQIGAEDTIYNRFWLKVGGGGGWRRMM